MTKQKELKLLKSCLFYYTLPSFIIWVYDLFYRYSYKDKGFCYFFERFHSLKTTFIIEHEERTKILPVPKHLILAYIGSKYYVKERLYCGYWVCNYSYNKKQRLNIRIELLKSAINSLEQQIKREKL